MHGWQRRHGSMSAMQARYLAWMLAVLLRSAEQEVAGLLAWASSQPHGVHNGQIIVIKLWAQDYMSA